MAQAMRPPASPVGSVLSDTHSMNLGTAQALAFCRVPRKASADDTVSPARSRPPMSKTSGSKHCRPRCWTISVCAAPSSRRRRGQKRRGFAGAPTAITSAWQRGTSSRSAPTAWSALPWATRPRPCRPGGAARGRCSAPIRSPRSSRVATDLVTALTGARNARMEILLSIILQDEITRLTGYRRHDLAHRAGQEGLKVSEVTMQK
jgi:hypothetical protein